MKNKIFISGLFMLCLGIAVVYHTNVWAQEDAAEEAEAEAAVKKVEKTSFSDIPFDELAAMLDDDAIEFVLKGMSLSALVNSVKGLSSLFKALVKFEADAVKAQAARARFIDTALCSEMNQKARQAASQCQAVKCTGGRSACLRQGIKAMKIMLAPLLIDGFIGYQQKDGKHVEGLALMTFDVVQQGGVKAQFNKDVVEPLKKVMKVLDVLEKSIQPKKKILANQGL